YETMRPTQGARMLAAKGKAASGPGMRAAVDFEQPLGVDAGINLRGRQRGMPEQFLDCAQVAAAGEQMGGEGMPQRMRRRAVGQAERAAQPFHRKLHDPGLQRAAPRADE